MAVRLLFDEQRLPVEEAARLMSLSLSAAASAPPRPPHGSKGS